MPVFDATIDLPPSAPVDAVRAAVRAMEGAGWIDVAAGAEFPPSLEWCVVYPAGKSRIPDTDEWAAIQARVRAVCEGVLARGAR